MQAAPHQRHHGQRSRGHLGPVSCGKPDPALDLSLLVVIPKNSEGVRISANYKKLNHISSLSQLPIPRVDQVLDPLGKGRVFSVFDLISSSHQNTTHKDTVHLTAFGTPTGLYNWLVMRQRSSTSLGWFIKVINEVIEGVAQVAVYLDDFIVLDYDSTARVKKIRALFEGRREPKLKLSHSKARLGATDVICLGHSITPAGIPTNAEAVSSLVKLPMPKNLKQAGALMGTVGYYRKFLPNLFKRIRPLTALLRKGYDFTPAMEVIVRQILPELAAPPALIFLDWDTVADGPRPYHVY